MENTIITTVGIVVSKGKSTVAVRRPGGEIVLMPFQVQHDTEELSKLIKMLQSLGGNVRVVMEYTGMYWRPIALALKNAGFFVSVVNAMLIQEDCSIVPVMYYPVENEGGIPYGLPMVSPDAQYNLLSPQKDALYGINLEAGTLTALAGWTQLDTSPSWFTGWADSVDLGPDGRIWSVEWSKDQDAYIIRSIGPIFP